MSRKHPECIELYQKVYQDSKAYLQTKPIDLDGIKYIKYEKENVLKSSYKVAERSFSLWDNAKILLEAKTLRRFKDFENSFHVLSKMQISHDSFWTMKYYLELANWFHDSGKFNTAIQIYSSLSREQKSQKLLSKVTWEDLYHFLIFAGLS